MISETGTRNISLTAGLVWVGAVPVPIASINTATDNLYEWTVTNGVWSANVVTQYNNTQYNPPTGPTALGANRYGVIWVYR